MNSKTSNDKAMFVIKRDGSEQPVHFDKITKRICYMCDDLNHIDPIKIAQGIISRVKSGITTSELDVLTADYCASKIVEHPDYNKLASRIIIDNHQKNCSKTFKEACEILYNNVNQKGKHSPLINDIVYKTSPNYDNIIQHDRDFLLDYFGFKTLQQSYLIKVNDKCEETPQYMFLRVAIGIHGENYDKVKETYDLLSKKYFTHATPTLFNSGTPHPQNSSCFLIDGSDDSIEGIMGAIANCAYTSKWSGGIGVHISGIRGNGSYISGTGGKSNGIFPMIKVYNDIARFINQGGKRNGSFAMYIEPWHCDIIDFLDCKKNHGDDNRRARDLFYALWVPDLFMERVFNNGEWSIMCPSECPGLADVYGDKFKELYEKYENEGKYKKKVKAGVIWDAIIDSQIETGTPYMLYKDACNKKSNQNNIGTIKCSNLCAEVIEYTSPDEISVCNLASVCLPIFVNKDLTFDYTKMMDVVKIVTRNLNVVIDINYYPTPQSETSNMKNRPIGIGVQGLSDTFNKMRIPYDSKEAKKINNMIFEAIYFAALTESCELAKEYGPYERYEGSPVSKGIFQYDMWDSHQLDTELNLDWKSLKENVKQYGVRNSLLTALMPTASTSQIMGNSECFEPVTSNWYVRRTLAGEFVVLNDYMVTHLIELNLWKPSIINKIMHNKGSIQNIDEIPEDVKQIYKTVWEIKQKVLVDLSADRGRYVDQSQSLNLFFEEPEHEMLSKAHYYGWKQGLKTGSYYIRSKPAVNNNTAMQEIDTTDECLNCSA